MTDINDESARKKALAAKYKEKIRQRFARLQSELDDKQYDFFTNYRLTAGQQIYFDLINAMKDPQTVPSKYITKNLSWLFGSAIPSRDKDMILYFADRLQDYSYSVSIYRRSFRASSNSSYYNKLIELICDYNNDNIKIVLDEPLEQILNRELPEDAQAYLDQPYHGCGYTAWQVAYALDKGNAAVEQAVRRILTEENSSGMMSAELIRGVLYSHRSDFHELMGKLLLAARLQEGLRQLICENADSGTMGGFLTILKVINDNNLIRFSSVKRAVGTWLGLIAEDSQDLERISKKSVQLIIECLENKSLRKEYLSSEDAMKIYIALWSYGVEDIYTAINELTQLAVKGSHHQVLVAGYFSMNFTNPYIPYDIAKKVIKLYPGEDDILAVWLPYFLPERLNTVTDTPRESRKFDYSALFDSKEELDWYYQIIKSLYTGFSGKAKTFSPCVFPWNEAKISKGDLAEILCSLAIVSGDEDKLDQSCSLIKDITSYGRSYCFEKLLSEPKTEVQRKAIIAGLADKETSTRNSAYKIVSKLKLSADDYRAIEEFLRYKTSDIREHVIDILLKQNGEELKSCIMRLLGSSKEEVRLGGLDMLLQIKKDESRKELADSFAEKLSKMSCGENISSKEKILLSSLLPKNENTKPGQAALFTSDDRYLPTELDSDYIELCANTFSEYFPESRLPELVGDKNGGVGLLKKSKSVIPDNTPCKAAVTAAQDLISLSGLIDAHKTESFVNEYGDELMLGNVERPWNLSGKKGEIPFMELWQQWRQERGITDKRIVSATVLFNAYKQKTKFSESCADFVRELFGKGFECAIELPYSPAVQAVLDHFCEELPKDDKTRLASAVAIWFVRCVPEDKVMIHAPTGKKRPECLEMAHLLSHSQIMFIYNPFKCRNDDRLKYTFPLSVAVAEKCATSYMKIISSQKSVSEDNEDGISDIDIRIVRYPGNEHHGNKPFVDLISYLYAAYQGIITERQLYEYLFNTEKLDDSLRILSMAAQCCYEIAQENGNTSSKRHLFWELVDKNGELDENDIKLIRFVGGIYNTIIPIILDSELSRGDSPAAYSENVGDIKWICGVDYFVRILSAMGNDSINRTHYSFFFHNVTDRKITLSHLLSVCIPAGDDSSETLREVLFGRNITQKRLIEAALFSPEWIPIVGKYLGIDSFESVCYYFIAHMNEQFDDKRKAMIARFTPLSEDELNLGAFDVEWFHSAYNSIGKKEFDLIYDAAKYITDGAKHSRARKYADAALGKLSVDETERAVSEKRNKDLLMAYALIPLAGEDDLCRRYLFIQRFRKESKQFGSQRITSEGKAVEMALKNLAINSGYSDTMRLTLRMETKVINDSRELLEEQIVDGVSLRILLDDNGKASLAAEKDGKKLKSVPSRIKKNETVVALTGMVKTLTEQYRRTRIMLERAMEESTAFTFGELYALSSHPVVFPMLKKLLLISENEVGFLAESGLLDASGIVHPLDESEKVWIAHPFSLYQRGCWRDYQKYLFDNRIVQPFRQVFRELYIKTADEMDAYNSLRYSGNQIQPAKTAAALKSRQWVADIETGLQKVYYSENIVAHIYALADWFSPADIEAPTLEWVCFSDRNTGSDIKISEIPDIIFSEVMRDVDLAVSVAHAGGVDPETSHSTIEMRAAILSFVLPMFHADNVKIEGRHAVISGSLADYTVHLGSGVVHQLGGAMIPVLPVHSQQRGKIFLPFVDDDPKTAEIISKILLFAEDGKIKDPMILADISKDKLMS